MNRNQVKPKPTNAESKKEQVKQMFDSIAHKYDFLNHLLSLGIDTIWRKKSINQLKYIKCEKVLDVATGTADMAILTARKIGCNVVGIDISNDMIQIGKNKVLKAQLNNKIHLQIADSENIPFPDSSFDAAISAFGVRNFENLEKGLSEMYRILKPGGKIVILEFSQPQAFPFKQLYTFYFKQILPIVGKLISKNKFAYQYLPSSVQVFPYGKDFLAQLTQVGFTNCSYKSVTFGIATIYVGFKSDESFYHQKNY